MTQHESAPEDEPRVNGSANASGGSAPSDSVAAGDATTPAAQWDPLEERREPHPASAPTAAPTAEDQLSAQIDASLAQPDPLALRPRTSSVVLCVVFGVVFLGVAAAVYWLGVHTVDGQSYEDLAIMNFADTMPAWLSFGNLKSGLVIGVSLAFGAAAMLVAAARKRWWLLGQLAVFAAVAFAAAKLLKPLLPRPLLVHVESSVNNSAPSGHTMLAAAAGLMLLAAVPRAWRACASVLSTVFTSIVGVSVIYDRWHRPVDVVMSVCIAGACMMFALACTRASGMDRTGSRASSPSVQIAATALITLGLCAIAYGTYVLWQVFPGLQYASAWAAPGACAAATAMVVGFAGLVNGMVLMMRQITAAPLTRLGLIGEPPAPPRKAAA